MKKHGFTKVIYQHNINFRNIYAHQSVIATSTIPKDTLVLLEQCISGDQNFMKRVISLDPSLFEGLYPRDETPHPDKNGCGDKKFDFSHEKLAKNAFKMQGDHFMVGLKVSHFNHGNEPNALMSPATVKFSTGRKTVFACVITARKITAGEEIIISCGNGITSPNSVLEKFENNIDPIRPQVDEILRYWLVTYSRYIMVNHDDLTRLGITCCTEWDIHRDNEHKSHRSLYPDLTSLDIIALLGKKIWISTHDIMSSVIYF